MPLAGIDLRSFVADQLLARNDLSRRFFDAHARGLAEACQEMARRFQRGGRLLAFGRGCWSTDAQHVAVEFVHPVIVGKRALPALDVSASFEQWVPGIVTDADIVMGFGPPEGDPAVDRTLAEARARAAWTFALPASPTARRDADPSFALEAPTNDPFITQELVEILYHTLWETVHVFFERVPRGARDPGRENLGASAFLYPFLGDEMPVLDDLVGEVTASIKSKAADVERLRIDAVHRGLDRVVEAIAEISRRLEAGGSLLLFGNGGSATDANDWAIDCVNAPDAASTVRALSLSMEPAHLTAIANDVGVEAMFLRQIVAHGRRGDVAVAISTSGGSTNVIAALEEARKRGLLTVALLGYDGGEVVRRGLADLPIVVDCHYVPRIQEVQASIYHVMTAAWRGRRG